MANLDSEFEDSDLKIDGLGSQGELISAIKTKTINIIELISSSSPPVEKVTSHSLFVGMLPNPGDSVKTINVYKGDVLISSKSVNPIELTLDRVLKGINLSSFKLNPKLSAKAFGLFTSSYRSYQKLKHSKLKRLAVVPLLVIREVIFLSGKQTIVLSDGLEVTKLQVIGLLDKEISLLRK